MAIVPISERMVITLTPKITSIYGDSEGGLEGKDWEAERKNGRAIKLYKKPVVSNYNEQKIIGID